MKTSIYTNNQVGIIGRVSRVQEYAPGKAANVTVAIDNGKDKDGNQRPATFVQTKSFVPAVYEKVKEGMLVQAIGHIATGSYDKNGTTEYTQDIVLDTIVFLESKATVDAREASKAAAEAE